MTSTIDFLSPLERIDIRADITGLLEEAQLKTAATLNIATGSVVYDPTTYEQRTTFTTLSLSGVVFSAMKSDGFTNVLGEFFMASKDQFGATVPDLADTLTIGGLEYEIRAIHTNVMLEAYYKFEIKKR